MGGGASNPDLSTYIYIMCLLSPNAETSFQWDLGLSGMAGHMMVT